jgi:16S rRNA (guanine527-N7)-methyltransferase
LLVTTITFVCSRRVAQSFARFWRRAGGPPFRPPLAKGGGTKGGATKITDNAFATPGAPSKPGVGLGGLRVLRSSRRLLYSARVTSDAIADLLLPYLGSDRLSASQLDQLAAYLDLLLRWNARTNLTSVRDPEHIVSRHFGESLFAARHLLPAPSQVADRDLSGNWPPATGNCADLGSGAGFPGLPLKIWAPSLHVTLIESQNKKATFLREVIRTLKLQQVEVFAGRAEDLLRAPAQIANHKSQITNGFDLVTLRAVDRYDAALAVAVRLLAPSGRLALLISTPQVDVATNQLRHLQWSKPLAIPLSRARVLLVGQNLVGHEPAS